MKKTPSRGTSEMPPGPVGGSYGGIQVVATAAILGFSQGVLGRGSQGRFTWASLAPQHQPSPFLPQVWCPHPPATGERKRVNGSLPGARRARESRNGHVHALSCSGEPPKLSQGVGLLCFLGLFPRFLLCPTPSVCCEVKEAAGKVTGKSGPLKTTVSGGCLCLEGSV